MKTTTTSLFFLALVSADAFMAPQPAVSTASRGVERLFAEPPLHDNNDLVSSSDLMPGKAALATAALWTATTELASAAGPDWGIFEGRTGSLLHPIVMGGLFLYSAYTAYLGFQWRRQRTLGDEISSLKKSLPDMGGAASVAEAVAAAEEAGDASKVAALKAAKGTEAEIATLQQERKDLAAAGPRDQHFAQGALLAFLGTAFAIEVRLCVMTMMVVGVCCIARDAFLHVWRPL